MIEANLLFLKNDVCDSEIHWVLVIFLVAVTEHLTKAVQAREGFRVLARYGLQFKGIQLVTAGSCKYWSWCMHPQQKQRHEC